MMTMAGGLVVKQSGIFLLKTVIPRLKEEGMKEIKKLWEVSDPDCIRNLEESLKSVEDLLKDPEIQEQKKSEVEEYKEAFLKLQHLAYDLEDILDTLPALAAAAAADNGCVYACGPNIHCLQPFYHLVNRILAFGSHVVQCFSCDFGENLPSRIQTMMLSLETNPMEGEVDNFHQLEVKLKEEAIPLRENTSLGDKRIVGREEETKRFIQMLVKEGSSHENYEVISIVGKGGLGKTTFAQYVYNHVQVNDHFKVRKAWVSMPETEHLDLTHVMANVINSAMKNKLTFGEFNLTQDKLLEVVKDKRFLIVLDDVWTTNPDHWEILKRPLQHGKKGSKVIVTTRLEEVANIMSQNSIHNIIHLKDFSDDECWVLFKRNARLGSDDVDLSEMQSEIIRRCNGLPLAAKALGRLFSKYQDESQRHGILNSSIWSEEGKALPVLRLSYFHLPLYLKPIFAYFALFPKGYIFNEMDIILLWMAQGMLLPKNQEERMEAIGHIYFDQLVSSSLVERSSSNQKCYVMHDLVHDLSVWAAGDICCHLMVNHGVTQQKEQLTRTRHLNLCTNDDIDELDQLSCTRQLRTFMDSPYGSFYDKQKLRDFILSLRSIRTLCLASSTIEELPECIGDLKFLMLLDLQFEKITLLPESIGRLCNLQVLLLTGCINLTKGLDFGLLKELRHVRFPRSLWKAMPLGISKLTDLQTLGDMYLGDDHGRGSMIRELKSLNHLHGELTIIGMDNVIVVEDAQEMHLDEKSDLEKLCLEYQSSDGEHDNCVLEQLKPNSCIKEYTLRGYMGSILPSWLGDPSFKKMVEIRLVNCHRCKQIPSLGQLKSLKKLWVEEMESLGGFLDSVIGKSECLEELVIKRCESFQGTLQPLPSCLKILRIENCPQARVSLPSSPKLEVLKVKSCNALLSSTDKLVIHCFEKIHLQGIKSGFTSLWVYGPCRQGLFISNCYSLVSIEKIPVSAEKVQIHSCRKLERVEWEEASASSVSNNNNGFVSIQIEYCDSVVRVGNIPLVVAQLDISYCKAIEEVKFGGKWNSVESSEATVGGDNNGPPQLELVELIIWCCPKLRLFAEGVLMPSLQQLEIWGSPKLYDTILRLPLTTLRDLIIEDFRNLKTIKWSTFSNLTTLRIENCCEDFAFFKDGNDCGQLQAAPIQYLTIKLMEAKKPIQEWGLDLLTHLQRLELDDLSWGGDAVIECIVGKDYSHTITSSPSCSALYLPSFSLRELLIFNCGVMYKSTSDQIGSSFNDLKSIDCSTFPNLEYIQIGDCPKLESLGPNNYLPPKLQNALITGSPLIEQQCIADPNGVVCFDYSSNKYTISNERQDCSY